MNRLLPLLLVACGPKLDPLLAMKAEVAAARQQGPAEHPHLRFAIDEATTLSIVEELAQLDEPRVVPLGGIGAARIAVHLDTPDLSIEERATAPHVQLAGQGSFDANVSTLLGSMRIADGLGFSVRIGGGLSLGLRAAADATEIVVVPVRRDGWSAEVVLEEEKGPLTNELVAGQIGKILQKVFSEETRIGRIPHTVPLRANALALHPAEHPMLDVWLRARPTSRPPPEPDPNGGFALATTDEAVLVGARSAMALVEQHRTWKIEPREVELRADRFETVLRLHKVARRSKWRDYRVIGSVEVSERLRVRAEQVEEIGRRGFGASLIGPFVKGRVKREVMRFDLDLPASTQQPVGKGALSWKLERIHDDDGVLTLEGTVSALEEAP